MHSIIITPFPLQGSMLSHSLKRHNIESINCSPQSLSYNWHPKTDAVLIPHPLNPKQWQKMLSYFKQLNSQTPMIFVGRSHSSFLSNQELRMLIKQSIFLDDSLSFDKMLLTVKEIVSKSKILKQDNEQLQIGNILLDRNERALVQKGVKTQLTGKEFHLLELLMINAGRVTTRESIIDHVWDRRNFVSQNTIEAYISRLRKKLNEKKNKGYIQTIPCLGYSFKHA